MVCCALNCKASASAENPLHRLPIDTATRKLWLNKLRDGDANKQAYLAKQAQLCKKEKPADLRCCRSHFKAEDLVTSLLSGITRVREGAVPMSAAEERLYRRERAIEASIGEAVRHDIEAPHTVVKQLRGDRAAKRSATPAELEMQIAGSVKKARVSEHEDIERLRAEKQHADIEIQSLRRQLEAAIARASRTQSVIDALQPKASSVEQAYIDLEEAKSCIETQRTEATATAALLEETRAILEEAQVEVARLKEQTHSLGEQLSGAEARTHAAQSHAEAACADLRAAVQAKQELVEERNGLLAKAARSVAAFTADHIMGSAQTAKR